MPAPRSLDAFTMVLLRRPEKAPQMSETEANELQERHLEYWDSLYGRGLLVHGPVRGQPDESIRGFGLFRLPVEDTRGLVDQDPRAMAGTLAMEVFTWYTVPGRLRFD